MATSRRGPGDRSDFARGHVGGGGIASEQQAGLWGCESVAPTSKYVALVATDGQGDIQVTTQGTGDATIDGKFISLVPVGNAALAAPLIGTQIYQWVCGNSAGVAGSTFVTTVPAKFLPSTCRG